MYMCLNLPIYTYKYKHGDMNTHVYIYIYMIKFLVAYLPQWETRGLLWLNASRLGCGPLGPLGVWGPRKALCNSPIRPPRSVGPLG